MVQRWPVSGAEGDDVCGGARSWLSWAKPACAGCAGIPRSRIGPGTPACGESGKANATLLFSKAVGVFAGLGYGRKGDPWAEWL